MTERLFPEKLIPPSINDQRSRALLGAFAFAASELDFAQLLKRNEAEMKREDLALALHDLSMNEFVPADGLPEKAARHLVAEAWPIQEKKGTDEGMEQGLEALGLAAEITHWWQEEPRTHHDTQVVGIEIDFSVIDNLAALLRAIRQMIQETKRWSQGSSLQLRVGAETKVGLGAIVKGLTTVTSAGVKVHPAEASGDFAVAAMARNPHQLEARLAHPGPVQALFNRVVLGGTAYLPTRTLEAEIR